MTFADIEAAGTEQWLAAVQEALRTETYCPHLVRRVLILKPGGTCERPLGIPTIQDRVVQTAALLILQPIFDADLEPTAYGYRPGRTALQAVQEVHRALCAGHTEVIDANISRYLETATYRTPRFMPRVERCRSSRGGRLVTPWFSGGGAEPFRVVSPHKSRIPASRRSREDFVGR